MLYCYPFLTKKQSFMHSCHSKSAKSNPHSVWLELSISLCLVFLMHHTQSLTLFILQPVSFFSLPLLVWWLSLHSLCSSRTPHSALSTVSDRTSQTAAMTDISQPLVSPLADLIPFSLSFPFTLNTRTALNRLSLASSKDYHNHHISLPVLELIGLTAPF